VENKRLSFKEVKWFKFIEMTDIGNRTVNEDYCAHQLCDRSAFFIVADGLGGHPKGEVASKEFCVAMCNLFSTYYQAMQTDPVETMKAWIEHAYHNWVDAIIENCGHLDCQTTFASVFLNESQTVIAHVGDSRVYRISRDSVWRTKDDTMLQRLLDEGSVDEMGMAKHQLQNQLLQAVSLASVPKPNIELQPPLTAQEKLVLCSDGFWEGIREGDLESLAKNSLADIDVNVLLESVKMNNGKNCDNIAVQVIEKQR